MEPSGSGLHIKAEPWTCIQDDNFSLDDEMKRMKATSPRIGGITVFTGTARDFSRGRLVEKISFEHFSGMAEKRLAKIRLEAKGQFDIIEVLIIHRIGEVTTGENIVLVMVGAEHRSDAFEACRWCIDELKRSTPIWKKEFTPEGEVWVEDRP